MSHSAKRHLYLIGTGPGDPELLTVKAVRILQSADIIFAPDNHGLHQSLDICLPHLRREGEASIPENVVFLEMPMKKMNAARYEKEAARIDELLRPGQTAAYLTLGDALTYSTAYLLFALLPEDIEVTVIPGITSYNMAFNTLKVPLTVKGERFMLLDEWPEDPAPMLAQLDRLALLKMSRSPKRAMRELTAHGFKAVYLSSLGMPGQCVLENVEDIPENSPYLSLIVAWRV